MYYANRELAGDLRDLRHGIRKDIAVLGGVLLANREAETDVGLSISQGSGLDTPKTVLELVQANF